MRGSGLVIIYSFGAGAVIGAVTATGYLKEKYRKEAEEEIEAVRTYYKEELTKSTSIKEKEFYEPTEEEKKTYDDIVKKMNYKAISDGKPYKNYGEEVEIGVKDKFYPKEDLPEGPYQITLNEFEEFDPYFDKVMLTYYDGDGILADDMDEIVNDVEETVGKNNLDEFIGGEFDSMYIRNPNMSVDYEISRVLASYKESVGGLG